MSQPKSSLFVETPSLSAETVECLATLARVPLIDAAMAERIAGGAQAAIAAVQVSALSIEAGVTFDCEPSDYLRVLETLAGDPS